MHKPTILLTLAGLGAAGIAASAALATVTGATAFVTAYPNRVSAAAAETVKIVGDPAATTLPESVAITFPRGLRVNPLAVPVLCSAKQASVVSCPAASAVGSGAIVVSLGGRPIALHTQLFLGSRIHAGDFASVYMVSSNTVAGSLTVTGRLFAAAGQLEMLIPLKPPAGTPAASLASFTFQMHASRTVTRGTAKQPVKVTYPLVTNPVSCAGTWNGKVTLTYATDVEVLPFSTPCVAATSPAPATGG